jgi:hypothetical protein
MIRRFLSFVLGCRLEYVVAVLVSAALLLLFLSTRLFHSFSFGMHDLLFILLPIGILGLKAMLDLLFASPDDEQNQGLGGFFGSFFRPFLKILRDWFPFLLLSACYYSLFTNLILRVNPHTADAVLARIDAAMFGGQPSLMMESWIRPWLTEFLNVIYFSFVLLLPTFALFFYLKREEKMFRRIMMGYLTIILMGVTSYLLVPAAGPETFFADQYHHDLEGQAISHGVDFIIRSARVGHDCFPSLHVAIPLLLAFYLRDYRRKLFLPALAYVAIMCLATIYLRYHYVIDVLAAFVYAPAAYFLNDFLLAHWPGERIADPRHAAVAPAPAGPAEPAGSLTPPPAGPA